MNNTINVIQILTNHRTQIAVCLHVIQSDGSEFAVGVNAATLALIDAGIPMKVGKILYIIILIEFSNFCEVLNFVNFW